MKFKAMSYVLLSAMTQLLPCECFSMCSNENGDASSTRPEAELRRLSVHQPERCIPAEKFSKSYNIVHGRITTGNFLDLTLNDYEIPMARNGSHFGMPYLTPHGLQSLQAAYINSVNKARLIEIIRENSETKYLRNKAGIIDYPMMLSDSNTICLFDHTHGNGFNKPQYYEAICYIFRKDKLTNLPQANGYQMEDVNLSEASIRLIRYSNFHFLSREGVR